MGEQRIPGQIRIHDAIDHGLRDAEISLTLIERLTEQINYPQTFDFDKEELTTLIRNCVPIPSPKKVD